jgi:hypothetical protein
MTKVATVNRGSTGQVTVVALVHPEKFNFDEEGEPINVRTVWLPAEAHINNGQGAAFYFLKGFIDPVQFLEYADYKKFKAKNKEAAKAFEDEALEDEAKQKSRDKDEEEERLANLSADALRHEDPELAPGTQATKTKAAKGVSTSGQGVG